MGNLNIKRCPRCNHGEVFIDRDIYGWYESCLQCGYTRDLPDLVRPEPAGKAAEAAVTMARKPGRPRKAQIEAEQSNGDGTD